MLSSDIYFKAGGGITDKHILFLTLDDFYFPLANKPFLSVISPL